MNVDQSRWGETVAISDAGQAGRVGYGAAVAITVDGTLLVRWWRQRGIDNAHQAEVCGIRWLLSAGSQLVYTDCQTAIDELVNTMWLPRTHGGIRLVDRLARKVGPAGHPSAETMASIVRKHPALPELLELVAQPAT